MLAGRLYESVSSPNEVLTDGRDGDGAVELPEVDALAERDVTNDMLSLIGGLCELHTYHSSKCGRH